MPETNKKLFPVFLAQPHYATYWTIIPWNLRPDQIWNDGDVGRKGKIL